MSGTSGDWQPQFGEMGVFRDAQQLTFSTFKFLWAVQCVFLQLTETACSLSVPDVLRKFPVQMLGWP